MSRLTVRFGLDALQDQLTAAEIQIHKELAAVEDPELVIDALAAAGIFVHFETLGAKELQEMSRVRHLWAELQPEASQVVSASVFNFESVDSANDTQVQQVATQIGQMNKTMEDGDDVLRAWSLYFSLHDLVRFEDSASSFNFI